MQPLNTLKPTLMLIAVLGAGLAQAATAWDENVYGDLSDDGLAPSSLSFAVGANRVLGSVGNSGSGVDRDYFVFVVPGDAQLQRITLLDNTVVSGGVSFIALQGGSQLTVPPSGAGASALLGFSHYGEDQIGQNILPALRFGNSAPLSGGSYAAWVQDTGGPATYGFDFVLAAVPEPASAALWIAGLLGLVGWRGASQRRRAKANVSALAH